MLEEGKVYSNLTILELVDWSTRRYRVLCKCGREFTRVINTESQLNGYCKSCRPLTKDRKNKAHPESRSRLYRIWQRMKSHCDNPQDPAYDKYGAKGVTYPDKWKNFSEFKAWALEHGYTEKTHLTRTTPLLDYSTYNCTWETIAKRPNDYSGEDTDEFGYDPHSSFRTF